MPRGNRRTKRRTSGSRTQFRSLNRSRTPSPAQTTEKPAQGITGKLSEMLTSAQEAIMARWAAVTQKAKAKETSDSEGDQYLSANEFLCTSSPHQNGTRKTPKGHLEVQTELPKSHADDTTNIININARYSRLAIPCGEETNNEER